MPVYDYTGPILYQASCPFYFEALHRPNINFQGHHRILTKYNHQNRHHGSSLVSHKLEYGKASCTLSGSYEEQVVAFGYPIKSTLKIDYSRLNRSLSHYHNCMEVNVLKSAYLTTSYFLNIHRNSLYQ